MLCILFITIHGLHFAALRNAFTTTKAKHFSFRVCIMTYPNDLFDVQFLRRKKNCIVYIKTILLRLVQYHPIP